MIRVTDKQYWMDPLLKGNLDSISYNMLHDFDTVVPITGDGMVRVGKSFLAQQVGYYMAWKLQTPFSIENIVFSGKELMEVAKRLPQNSVIIYDEARGELDAKKVMENITKTLMDFFAECGMYNHVIILVCPDYFELPKGVALSRSEFLLNVVRTASIAHDKEGNEVVKFERGVFEFYNRKGKKVLYIQGKKNYNDYDIGKKWRSFWGNFPNTCIVDLEEYKKKKLNHIMRTRGVNKDESRFSAALYLLNNNDHYKFSQRQIAAELKEIGVTITQERICQLIAEVPEFAANKTKINDK